MSHNSSGTFENFKKDLTSVLKVQNERFANLQKGFLKHSQASKKLSEKQESLCSDLAEFKTVYLKDYHKFLTLTSILEMGNAKLLLLNDLEQHVHSWVLGLMALSGHKITRDLVPYSTLRLMLNSVSTELKESHPSLKLAINKVEYYYSL